MATSPDRPAPTPDGNPTPLRALNTGVPSVLQRSERGLFKRLASAYRKLNLIMAGMYTGVGCSGTPHSHHTYPEQDSRKPTSRESRPD